MVPFLTQAPKCRGLFVPGLFCALVGGTFGLQGMASAQGLTLDTTGLFQAPPDSFSVCWARPVGWPRKARVSRFDRAFMAAANQTMPDHVNPELERMLGGQAGPSCRFTVRSEFVGVRTEQGRALELRVQDQKTGTVLLEDVIGPVRAYRLTVDDFVAAWTKVWSVVAPVEPPAPEPSPEPAEPVEPAEPYVDPDLAQLRAEREAALRSDPGPPVVSVVGQIGATARSLDTEVGRPQDASALLSFGAQAELHVGSLVGFKRQELDVVAEYWRQVVGAELGPERVGAQADRVRASARYGRSFFRGDYGPTLGLESGYAFRRFVFDDSAATLSVEYSALRAGGYIRQPLFRNESVLLTLALGGAARFTLGDGNYDVGADADAVFRIHHASGFLGQLRVGYTLQSGTIQGSNFSDDVLDMSLGLGWSL